MSDSFDPRKAALVLVDLQNDFLHPRGVYARGGATASAIAALPARLKPVADAFRRRGGFVLSTHFTLVPGREGEPLIGAHLKKLRPFLGKGDFVPGGWGHALVDKLQPADFSIEKVAYSVFSMSRMEFVLQRASIDTLVFVEWKRDSIVLAGNLDYYAGRPFLDRLEYQIFTGQQVDRMYESFRKQELEDSPVPTPELDAVRDGKRFQFVRRPILGDRFFGFDTAKEPLSNRMLRQAFNFALDRNALVQDVYKGRYKAGHSFVPPGTYGYDPQYNPYPYDPERARALLAKAGFPAGKGLPVFQIWSNPRTDLVEREHEKMRRQLAEVGIRVEFRYNTDWPSFNREAYEGKLPVFRYGWVADLPEPENFLYRLFHSQSRSNLTRYNNSRVDRLLDQARIEQDSLKRVSIYRDAERLIMEE